MTSEQPTVTVSGCSTFGAGSSRAQPNKVATEDRKLRMPKIDLANPLFESGENKIEGVGFS